ncbi:FAD/NAD(P)-binding domain-containing protein [Hyaloscypha variabilis F]|uniref:FAD/NAD(P)-binding domain-containing protein n=1 Tax=Hyaloscypha variabilis (strain UAMH 11265 / GT02V1 / F) TaxID=1149755 RepID=A0A2J6R182_HYAVF|nr:FAD/NAD(P)-binding domain-containing protein [Hyaloscypha variabilis F]
MGSLEIEPSLLRVAIVGTGIAGLTAGIALRKHPKIEVALYEKATELKEIGASITLGPNGLRTLQRLGLEDCISDQVGYRGPNPISRFYRHWKTNEIIGEDFYEDVSEPLHYTARFHRGHLQQALLKHIPRDIIHLKKKLVVATVDHRDGVKMQFQDGTTATADILIGADGIRSGVRTAFVPDFELEWSGHTAFRGIFDASLVKDIEGVPLDSTHWWGPETNFFATRLAQNRFTVQGGIYADPQDPVAIAKFRDGGHWDKQADINLLREKYLDWNPVVKALANVTPDIRYYPNYFCGSSLPTWIFGDRVTLIGDAAHAHGGAFATGGSLAIDDAYALHLALKSVFPETASQKPSSREILRALKLYEDTRRPHAVRLLKVAHENNAMKTKKIMAETQETDEELRARAKRGSGTTWLHEHDVVKSFDEVLAASSKNT